MITLTTQIEKQHRNLRRQWKPTFLKALRDSGNVRASSEVAGIERKTAYLAYDSDSKFRVAWDEALAAAFEMLEGEARRRALATSDVLLIFLLKANSAKYRFAEQHEISGPNGGPIELVVAGLSGKLQRILDATIVQPEALDEPKPH